MTTFAIFGQALATNACLVYLEKKLRKERDGRKNTPFRNKFLVSGLGFQVAQLCNTFAKPSSYVYIVVLSRQRSVVCRNDKLVKLL